MTVMVSVSFISGLMLSSVRMNWPCAVSSVLPDDIPRPWPDDSDLARIASSDWSEFGEF